MSRSIRAVAFDLDGLMFNTEELYEQVGGIMLERRGKQICSDLLNEMMGRPAPVALQRMIDWHQLNDTVQQLQAETDDIFERILPDQLAPLAGLLELLDALSAAGIPMAITTSSRRVFVEKVMAIYDLSRHFKFWLTAEDVQQGKPHPEIYRKAAERLGVAASAMMVLEDSQNGCRAAVSAEACTVAVPGPHSRHHDFSGARLVAESLSDPRIYELLGLNPNRSA